MTVKTIQDVGFGDELEAFTPNNSLDNTSAFARAVKYDGSGRFEDHEKGGVGLPGAIVPGIMGMAFLTSMIHRWAPEGEVVKIDTVFRAPMLADKPLTISAIVTDIDEDEAWWNLTSPSRTKLTRPAYWARPTCGYRRSNRRPSEPTRLVRYLQTLGSRRKSRNLLVKDGSRRLCGNAGRVDR